ncbi:MAG: ribonuclease III [Candidatus Delongbacteria bacterium]|nr:ribonuclease III [Candidatus Delongbacteria bacterium]
MLRTLTSLFFNKDKNIPHELLENIRELEGIIGYRFRNKNLLIQALKHRSFTARSGEERKSSNERLEFLGDSVLNFLTGQYFYENFTEKHEGDLTKMRSILVSGENLSETARKIDLGKYILVGDFEERTGGRDKDSILEDCMEALIGAVFIDGGIEKASSLVKKLILNDADEILRTKKHSNYKSELLELVQSKGYPPPTYELTGSEGPEHEKTFTVNVIVDGKVIADGTSNSKKRAEQEASARALELIKRNTELI